MRINEIEQREPKKVNENWGFKGEYSEPYVHLLGEMCIVVSLMLDKGYKIDIAIKRAIHEFNEDLLMFDVSVEKAEKDLMRERGDDLTLDGYSNQSGSKPPIDEITKEEFVDKLKDPIQFRIKDSVKKLRDILDESKKFKMSKIEYINHNGRDVIKFIVFFPQGYIVDYPEDVNALQRMVFDPFKDIIEPKMSDAIYVRTGGRPKITFTYYLKR